MVRRTDIAVKTAAATAQPVSASSTPEAPASVPAPKGTHRVVGELWYGKQRLPHDAELTLTDEEAEQLGDAVVKL